MLNPALDPADSARLEAALRTHRRVRLNQIETIGMSAYIDDLVPEGAESGVGLALRDSPG